MSDNDTTNAIEIEGLTKEYGDFTALDDIDLTIEEGEIFGFLGPNGAGKSTTINVLLDFVRPTEGTVNVLGFDSRERSREIRQRTGVLPEGYALYDRLTAREHLEYSAEAKGANDSPEAILERVGIPEAIDRKVGSFSKGMTQRLAFGAALIGEPELLVLDEPSSGLDPAGAQRMREIVFEERERGATVFFSSHVLEQVEAACDRVGILRDGSLVAKDTVENLRDETTETTVLTVEVDRVPSDVAPELEGLSGVSAASADSNTVTARCQTGAKISVLNHLQTMGATIRDFDLQEPSLEEIFMSHTQEEER